MAEEDKWKTAFSSPLGLLQFITMPFGLSGAPATFQWLMDKVLRGTEAYAGVYLDDIIIYGETRDQNLENIRKVFERLWQAGLTKKCSFGASECIYLGHQIGKGGVRPEATKVQAFNDMPRPRMKKEIQSFLGMIGYYRRLSGTLLWEQNHLPNWLRKESRRTLIGQPLRTKPLRPSNRTLAVRWCY